MNAKLSALLLLLASAARCAEAPTAVAYRHIEPVHAPQAIGAIRSQADWDSAVRAAHQADQTTPARSHPVDWRREMIIAAPALVSSVQRDEDALTVSVIGDPRPIGSIGDAYLIALPATAASVRFVRDPAMRTGPYYVATASVNHYTARTKKVVLYPLRPGAPNERESWRGAQYVPLRETAMRKLASSLKASGLYGLTASKYASSDWSGEGECCQAEAVNGGERKAVAFEGRSWLDAPRALMVSVRAIFAAGGSPGMPE